jgi:ATP-dependent helicase/nuclease subunit B
MTTPRLPWDEPSTTRDPSLPAGSDRPLQRVSPALQETMQPPSASTHQPRVPSTSDLPPGPRRVVSSASAAVRLAVAADVVRSRASHDQIVVAMSHKQADDFVRETFVDAEAVCGVHRAGLTELVTRLATPRLAAEGVVPLSALGFDAVMARIVNELEAAGRLGNLTGATVHPGFLRALSSTVQDLRLAGVVPGDLDTSVPRLAVLRRCLEAADLALTDLGQADRARLLRMATAALAEPAAPSTSALPLTLLDPTCGSRLELEFCARLVSSAPNALVVGPEGDAGLQRLAEALDIGLSSLQSRQAPARLAQVQQWVFQPQAPPAASPADQSVELFSAPGEGRECIEVARRIAAHARAGIPFDRIAVVLRAPHLYAAHLESALERAGIPAVFALGTRRPDPAGRAFLALLACGLEGMSARRFAEYLSLGQVPTRASDDPATAWQAASDPALAGAAPVAELLPSASGETRSAHGTHAQPRRSPWRWERLLNDAVVIGGHDRWQRRLQGFREEILTRRRTLAADEPESPRLDVLERQAALVDELIAFACPVVNELAAWSSRASWGEWLDRLDALAVQTLRRPDRVRDALADLRPLSEVADVPLADVHAVLHERLTHVTVSPPDSRYGAVFVGTPDDLRARTFRVVFVPGLSERVFPQRPRQDPLLLDALRGRVSSWLATDATRVADERLRLRLAVGAATEGLVTSFASFDTAQSRPRVPSFYALDVQRACEGALPGYQRLMREAQQASGARLAWPAPTDAAMAIDDAEHDLAVLQRHLRGSVPDVRGRARYLFELSPAVRRSLLARHRRGRRTWTPADGLVADMESAALVSALLAPHRLPARPYSVSALQRFAVCPYQFHLSTIVRLAPREDAEAITTLDPLTRGSMVHEMLAALMRAFVARGWVPLTSPQLPDALDVADEIVADVAESYRDRLAPAIERVWLDEVAAVHRDVREWVRRLPDDQTRWRARFVEMGFGFGRGDGRDAESRRQDVVLPGGTRLHGVVDLIEEGDAGTWRVTDYKTGRARLPAGALVDRGETLQPALYAMAVEAALGGRVTDSRLWYCTTAGGFSERSVPVDESRGASAREPALQVLAAIDRSVDVGFLPAAPRDEACRWCDFVSVCGPGAQYATRRKDRSALEELHLVRRQR